MSRGSEHEIACPQCGNQQSHTLWDSISVSPAPASQRQRKVRE